MLHSVRPLSNYNFFFKVRGKSKQHVYHIIHIRFVNKSLSLIQANVIHCSYYFVVDVF